jgi:NNP family nitrate/nitrite transporter-like MFS transporter
VIPGLIGLLGEKGFFSAGFVVTGLLVLAGAVVPLFLKFQQEEEDSYPEASG